MLCSSLGFHTLTLFIRLTAVQAKRLKEDFQRYSKETGLIKIYPLDAPRRTTRIVYDGGKATRIREVKSNYKVSYYQQDHGIEWLIRYNNWSSDFQSYIIEVTINPKILGGIHDYVTAATYADMEAAIINFNHESARISPILMDFECYRLKRIDYCINFDLNELVPGCDPNMIMELIRRGDIPPHYQEFKEYDDKSHRMKRKDGSFYLMNPSVNINCYSKLVAFQNRSKERESMGRSPVPQAVLDSATGVIRFEIQFKYYRTYRLSKTVERSGNHDINKYESLLNLEMCTDIVNQYFNKVIGKGDWYTLQAAIHKIQSQHFNKQRENRLISALQHINQCRSLAKAKASFQDNELKSFKRTLKELSSLGINPVTIPKEWGVKHIPNLLYTYHNRVQQENMKKSIQEFQTECLEEYIRKHGKLPS